MASSDAVFARLANRMSRPGPSSVRTPRSAQLSMHQGYIHDVDEFTNTVHWQFNGDDQIIQGVRYMLHYTATDTPQAGDNAFGYMNGTSFIAAGRLLIPNSSLSLP